ncbi:hypothetical protein GPJ56_010091 [Histomonas meleagridis]|uniref:uncharacterized protein n=1 Tax=Histomonas meleagridis TaxID=135588 RepID=UPI0035599047|nr:hypothetical protein GPJ56_010091 [Histomonas meleagridis]KAH0806747.1 hypothetical protein GO595_000390 [Histomonas meleagridis]
MKQSDTGNSNPNIPPPNPQQNGNPQPPPGYPPYPGYYPYPYQYPPQPNNQNQSNQQNAPPPPYGYPYPPPPPQNNQKQPNQPNQQNQQTPPPPPYGYQYPYPYPPPPPNGSNGQPNGYPYPPFPYPPPYGYPYPYPPPQPQQAQQAPPQDNKFDWEKNRFANSQPQQPQQSTSQQNAPSKPPPVFDWEKRQLGIIPNDEPPAKIEIDWNYKPDYVIDEPIKEVERDPEVSAICTSRLFDPSQFPDLPDSFFKLSASETMSLLQQQQRNKTFQKRSNAPTRDTARVKFQFGNTCVSDLTVTASFHVEEPTKALYDFLSDFVFADGSQFYLKTLIPPKAIASTLNQRLKDFKLQGKVIVQVGIKHFTGLKQNVEEIYNAQREEIAKKVKELEEKEKEKEKEIQENE